MKVQVINESGKKGSDIEVSDTVFGCAFNEPLVHQAMVAFQANGRQGSRAQKNRAAVRGGGVKPWRQKGTGRARAGTIRSPLWRTGGRTFPSSPDENFTHKLNRKMYRGAMRAILSELVRAGRLTVLSHIDVTEPKTKKLASFLHKLDFADALIVTEAVDRNLDLAARNLPHVDVRNVAATDPVALLRHKQVIVTPEAVKRFEEVLQ
jgi:large subunit ribosomal protein L4